MINNYSVDIWVIQATNGKRTKDNISPRATFCENQKILPRELSLATVTYHPPSLNSLCKIENKSNSAFQDEAVHCCLKYKWSIYVNFKHKWSVKGMHGLIGDWFHENRPHRCWYELFFFFPMRYMWNDFKNYQLASQNQIMVSLRWHG